MINLTQADRFEVNRIHDPKKGKLGNTVYVHGNKSQGKRVWMLRMTQADMNEIAEVIKHHQMDKPDEVIAGYFGSTMEHPEVDGRYFRHGEYGVQIWPVPDEGTDPA